MNQEEDNAIEEWDRWKHEEEEDCKAFDNIEECYSTNEETVDVYGFTLGVVNSEFADIDRRMHRSDFYEFDMESTDESDLIREWMDVLDEMEEEERESLFPFETVSSWADTLEDNVENVALWRLSFHDKDGTVLLEEYERGGSVPPKYSRRMLGNFIYQTLTECMDGGDTFGRWKYCMLNWLETHRDKFI
jgi:hypothetical protein